jgi:MFS family permease
MQLRPDSAITGDDVQRGIQALVRDSAWASLAGSLYGGVILVGFALSLGATPATIGALSAIPLFAQLVQLPTIALVERIRQRRKITVVSVTLARLIILGLAFLPYLPDLTSRLRALLAAQLAITMLGSIAGCSLNSWLHQLLPKEGLGRFFARRLFWSTVFGAAGAALAGYVADYPFLAGVPGYSVNFVAAGLAGFVSSWFLITVPEPVMQRSGPPLPIWFMVGTPFREGNFRRVIVFMMSWNFASSLAAPFIAVFVLQQLHYSISMVTWLWIASQIANALTLYLWGRLSDRLSNKSILAVALPLYFGCMLGLVFVAAIAASHFSTVAALFALHAVMGLASGGIGLATASLGLKLAPPAHATSYLASVSLSGALAGAAASLLGGVLADWFASRRMALVFYWISPVKIQEVTVIQVQHWAFLFAISFVLGFYVLHALSRIAEGAKTSERVVIQQFVVEAMRSLDQLSSIEGLRLSALFPFGRLLERRRQARKNQQSHAPAKGDG